MANTADVTVGINANIKGFLDGLSQCNNSLGNFSDMVGKAGKGLAALAVIGGIGKIVKDLTEMTLAAGRNAEQISQLSQITGLSSQKLQDWSVAFNRVGVSQQDLALGMKTLAQKMEEARAGTGAATDRFKQLGIDIKKVGNSEDALRLIADRVGTMKDGMEKSAIMTDLLGRAGQKMIPAFEGGAKALDDAAEKAYKFGKFSEDQLKTLGETDDAVDDMGKAWEGLTNQIGALFAPVVKFATEVLTDMITFGIKVIREMQLAAETLTLRFVGFASAVSEVAGQLFSLNAFSVDAWKQTFKNVAAIDQETAGYIALARAKADAFAKGQGGPAPDGRVAPPVLVDSKKAAADAQSLADSLIKTNQAIFKNFSDISKASAENAIAYFELYKQTGVESEEELARHRMTIQDGMDAETQTNLAKQIANYIQYVNVRKKLDEEAGKSDAERKKFELDSSQTVVAMLSQLNVEQLKADTNRINGQKAVEAAVQKSWAAQNDEMKKSFELYQAEKAKELDIATQVADAQAALLEADAARAGVFFDRNKQLNEARLAAAKASYEKELAVVGLTTEQKEAIDLKYFAKKTQLFQQWDQSLEQRQQRELDGDVKVAQSSMNLAKAKYDLEFALFRDTDALRAQQMAVLDAQYAADLNKSQLTAQEKLAIEQNYVAQRIQVASQFPTFWEQQLLTMQQSAQFAYGTILSNFSSTMAGVIQGTATMAQFFQSMLNTMLQAAIQMLVQLMAQWLLATLFKTKQDGAQVTAHTAMETAKTAATTAGELARTALVVASNKVMLGAVNATLVAIGAMANAALAAIGIMVNVVAAAIYAMAAAVVTIPVIGQAAAGAMIVGATKLEIGGNAAVLLGVGALNTALGAATVAATSALATPFAAGGIVTGPTFAMIGEAGPEAVIPLSQLGEMGGPREIVIHNHNHTHLNGRELAYELVPEIISALRLRYGIAI